MVKKPEQIVAQKAIICLYLRKRSARRMLGRLRERAKVEVMHPALKGLIDDAWIQENEAHNALESMKRVLWHERWD
jgi:hypothetical protein